MKLTINDKWNIVLRAFVSGAITIAAFGSLQTSFAQQPQPEAQWPTGAPHKVAIDAFTKSLTKASRDADFRKKLLDPATAKDAVAKEGNVNIPPNVVILFYESEANATPQASPGLSPLANLKAAGLNKFALFATNNGGATWRDVSPATRGVNENYHVFCLPPFNKDGTQTYEYKDFLVGCYPVWWN
jgi:hypothetical protein